MQPAARTFHVAGFCASVDDLNFEGLGLRALGFRV